MERESIVDFVWKMELLCVDNLENELGNQPKTDEEQELYDDAINTLYNLFDRLKLEIIANDLEPE